MNPLKRASSFLFDRFFIKRPRLRRAVTRALFGDSDRFIEICGTRLRINTLRENGYLRASQLCQRSSLLRDELSVLVNLAFILEPGDTFVDVGANVGMYAHTIARLARLTELPVYAFEAHPETYRRLVALDDGIIAEQCALSDQAGSIEFCDGAVSHVFTALSKANAYSITTETITVPAKRLDQCEIAGDSLVIKIDVEGSELEVLRSAEGLLTSKRVKAIYVDGYEANEQVPAFLSQYGFALYDGRSLETAGAWFSLLAIHPDKTQRQSAYSESK